jgi:tetratricopeptide (TPR) repeat protein
MAYEWDWRGAEREFRQAIQLNPGEPFSRCGYGGLLFSLKRFDESLAQMKRAQELDPLSPVVLTSGGLAFYFARQYDRAIEQLRAAIELEPAYFWAHTLLAMAYEQKGEARKAIAEFQKARKLSQSPFTQANLARGYAMAGNRAEALKLVAELEEDCKRLCVAPYDVAAVYAGLGEKDQALTWLERAYATRSWFLPWLQIDARFDGLRSDPRFLDLVRRMGFPQ